MYSEMERVALANALLEERKAVIEARLDQLDGTRRVSKEPC